MKNTGAERRKFPRVQQHLPIRVAIDGYDFMTSTENISCIGAYCEVNKYIPPFTRVMIRMTFPVMTDVSSTYYDVVCSGVVVRSEDNLATNGFNIAIFFNDIKDSEREKIERYVQQFSPQVAAVSEN